MEYLDTPLSILFWKDQLGESLSKEEQDRLAAWQQLHPRKTPYDVQYDDLQFHYAFKKRRQLAMERVYAAIAAPRATDAVEDSGTPVSIAAVAMPEQPVVPELFEAPVVPMRQPSWYRRNRQWLIAAAVVGIVAIGWYQLKPSGTERPESGQTQAVAAVVPRPLARDTALFVEVADGQRFAVGTKDTGLLARLGNTELRSTGARQLVYQAVAGQVDEALINHTIITAIRKPVRVALADHSVATLGPQSRLQVNVSGSSGERSVTLTGLGYFSVAHDASRPFVVDAGGVPVRVLGTEFVVQTQDRGFTTVALQTGSVQVGGGDKSARLKPGQAVQVSRSGAIQFVPKRANSLLAFTRNEFYYTDHTLAVITADIEQWHHVQLIDNNPADSLSSYHFGPVSRDLPLQQVLDKLEETTGHRFKSVARP